MNQLYDEINAKLYQSLQDPFSVTTRKTKRNLLMLSVLGITIVKAKIPLTEISALGIKTVIKDPQNLLLVLVLAIVYNLISYFVYAYSDKIALRLLRNEVELHQNPDMIRYQEKIKIRESPKSLGQITLNNQLYGGLVLGYKDVNWRFYYDIVITAFIAIISICLLLCERL